MGLFSHSSCVLCDASVSRTISLCESCEGDLPRLVSACKQCGLPLGEGNEYDTVCGECLKTPPSIDYTMCLYHYQSPLDYLITHLKYNQQLSHAAILGYLLSIRVKQEKKNDLPDCIIPVPLHKSRLVKRGFNQSLEITRPVAKALKLPIDTKLVRRTRKTSAQADLNAVKRRKNVKNCFEIVVQKAINYSHVVIVDDVVTTGSTINELAQQLKQSGIKKVGVWAISRAILT